MTQDLYIIAAGKGSRMGGSLPKALVPINGDTPCLTTTLQQIGNKFLNVFLVVNIDILDVWEKYLYNQVDYSEFPLDYIKNVTLVPIKSGLGDGPKSTGLSTTCPDLTKPNFQKQTDGEIFYKITNGRDEMPAFAKKITEDNDKWAIVNYIRTFKKQ